MIVEEHGLGDLAADLRRAGRDIVPEVKKVTEVALAKMKKDATRLVKAAQLAHLKQLTWSYDYEVAEDGAVVVGEVGALESKKRSRRLAYRQGSLDWIAEYGTPGFAPVPHWRPAADKEIPVWEQHLDDAAAKALGDLDDR